MNLILAMLIILIIAALMVVFSSRLLFAAISLAVTSIMVTHDQAEAFAVADTVAVIDFETTGMSPEAGTCFIGCSSRSAQR